MVDWCQVEAEVPEFAAAVRAVFDAHRHRVLATLRADGSPRVSGIETQFVGGALWLGMMDASRKAADLRRDPRLALHCGSPDPPDDPATWTGDAKVAGRAVEVGDPALRQEFLGSLEQQPPGPFDLFRVDLAEVVLTRVGEPADHLVIESWREGQGLRRTERA